MSLVQDLMVVGCNGSWCTRPRRGHHVYKTVWTLVIGEQLHLEKESRNPHNDFAVAVIKDHQPSTSPLLAPGAITWPGDNPWKPRIVPGVYSRPGVYFCLSALTPRRLNETRRLYETGRNSRQYGISVLN